MDIEFTSQKELFERVKPALNVKIHEFNNLGFTNIKDIDIWEYLKIKKWKSSSNLMLNEIVEDILNIEYNEIYEYVTNINRQ